MNYQKVYMNQIYSSSIMRQVAQMWKNQLLCDAVIKTGNINTKAHRLVLIAACPMLQHMENASVGSHLEVRLNADIKQESVTAFLQYLYEGYMMLTEENCKDVEKIAKLLHADSVAKCCVDFQKCLSSKSGFLGSDSANFDVQDSVEFRYVCSTNMQKSVSEGAMKRTSENAQMRPQSPGAKRQRVQMNQNRMDDRFSMAHSYSTQDPFERVPRLGFPQPKPPPGVIEIIEDSVELISTDPPEKDSEGWPKKSNLPPIQRSMSISVASQVKGGDSDIQIINVSSPAVQQQGKTSTTTSDVGRMRPSVERHSASYDHPQQLRIPERQTSYNIEQSRTQRLEQEPLSRQQFSHSASPKQISSSSPRTIHPLPVQSPQQIQQPPQLKPMPHPVPQNKPFAAGSASQASSSTPQQPQAMSPLAASPRNVPETSHPLPSPTRAGQDSTKKPDSVPDGSTQQQQSENNQSEVPEKDTGQKLAQSTDQHTDSIEVERLLAPDPAAGQSGESSGSKTQENVMDSDLSIVKIEEADTGGLDMYVDIAEDNKQFLGDDEGEETGEIEDPPGEWGDFSNESSNVSTDPNASWQDGSFSKGSPSFGYGSAYYFPAVSGPGHPRFGTDSVIGEPPSYLGDSTFMEGFEEEYMKHPIVPLLDNKKRLCLICQVTRRRTVGGCKVSTRHMCGVCGVYLCKGERGCYLHYHQILYLNGGKTEDPRRLVKEAFMITDDNKH